MPMSRRTPAPTRMPPGNSTLMNYNGGIRGEARPAFTVHRLSKRSFRWRLVDDYRVTGTATTQVAAEKAAMAAWSSK